MEKQTPKTNEQKLNGSSQNVHLDVDNNEGNIQAVGAGRDVNLIQKAENVYIAPLDRCDSNSPQPSIKIAPLVGTMIAEDHKYEGKLVYINLGFAKYRESEQTKEITIRLSISFSQVEEEYKYGLRNGFIRFGINFGELCLSLPQGVKIPLHQRGLNKDSRNEWQINLSGDDQAPTWQFTVKDDSKILQGTRVDENLGSFELLAHPSDMDIQAVFQVLVNRNNIKIMAQDLWDSNTSKKVKETEFQVFLKRVVEPKLKEYVSKVILRYE